MTYSAIVDRLPAWLSRYVLHFEAAIEDAVAAFAAALPPGARVLDAGAGESRHARYFTRQRYCGVDLAVGDRAWNYSRLDAVADLTCLPFVPGAFQAAINIVTLEHVRDPESALREIARTLAPGAPLLIVVPHAWEVHQAPHDYFRFTRHGIEYLLQRAGMAEIQIRPVGGYFRLLARRLLNGLQFFSGGIRWLGFFPAALLLVPPALVIPCLDFLDRDRNFTLGYICTAKKSS
ncbi:MAG TPA: class I SAM-dependent methyltransferase [Bryobacteraceae bacterium]|nr:class I SAM-dependent methyltransferase [Bryobacteraceae bacterium]